MASVINFDSPIPYYLQLIDLLKQEISKGAWQVGSRIPSEAELCESYGVSRTVVRQALDQIEHEGFVVRRKGKGTFVAEPKINEGLAQKLTGFFQDMTERGLKPSTLVLRQEVIAASNDIAGYLGIEPGASVVAIERLRSVENEPIVLVTSYLSHSLCPQLVEEDLTTQSLYAVLEAKYGFRIAKGRRYIEAVAANEREAQLLQIDEGTPLVLLDSVSYLQDGTPIEYFHALHRGDRSRFAVDLVRVRDQQDIMQAIESIKTVLPSSN